MATQKSLWEVYEDWLLEKMGFDLDGYDRMLDQLHRIPFRNNYKLDSNRIGDAIYLREEFLEEKRLNPNSLDYYEDGYVLEILVALAIRVDDEYIGDPAHPHPERFFWEMICNLGLDQFTDRRYSEDEIFDITVRWMCRSYRKNGEGSIFPVKKPSRDQRSIEIWDQMQEYLRENYV